MKNPASILCAAVLGVAILSFCPAQAAPPRLLPFQGRLTDASGTPVADGAKVVQFKIYDAPTGGTTVWNGEVQKLTVNGGLVSTLLGSKAPLDAVDFNQALYLEITVDANADNQITAADPPLLPRQSVLPAVFAVEASAMSIVDGTGKRVGGAGWNALVSNSTDPVTANWRVDGSKLVAGSVGGAQLASNITWNGLSIATTSGPNVGVLTQSGSRLLHTYGPGNFFAGLDAGNFTTTGLNNTGVGTHTLQNLTSGSLNVATGLQSLRFNSSGGNNTALGTQALNFNTTGSNNIALGYQAGFALTTGSNNIHIGHNGVADEGNTIRIGAPGTHTTTYVAGLTGTTISGGSTVAVDSQGKLGKAAPRVAVINAGTKVGDIVYAGSSGAAGAASNPATVLVPGQSITHVSGGGAVELTVKGVVSAAFIGVNGTPGNIAVFSIWRDGGNQIAAFYLRSVGTDLWIPPSCISAVDYSSSAGSHTYELRVQYTGSGQWWANNVSLTAAEY